MFFGPGYKVKLIDESLVGVKDKIFTVVRINKDRTYVMCNKPRSHIRYVFPICQLVAVKNEIEYTLEQLQNPDLMADPLAFWDDYQEYVDSCEINES